MWYINTMEYYSSIKKNDIMPFAATWMELETLILSEMSERERGREKEKKKKERFLKAKSGQDKMLLDGIYIHNGILLSHKKE